MKKSGLMLLMPPLLASLAWAAGPSMERGKELFNSTMNKLLLFPLLFLASSAYGEIYTWNDSGGTHYYTNDQYEIPERYRAKAKVMNLGIVEKKDNSSPQQDAISQQNAPQKQSEQQILQVKPAQPPAFQRPAGNSKREHAAKRMRRGRSPED